jgi:hypothetical protein
MRKDKQIQPQRIVSIARHSHFRRGRWYCNLDGGCNMSFPEESRDAFSQHIQKDHGCCDHQQIECGLLCQTEHADTYHGLRMHMKSCPTLDAAFQVE